MTATDLLAELQNRSIALSADNGNLRISAPRDALTPELRRCLVENKAELLALLHAPECSERQAATQTPQDSPTTALEASGSLGELEKRWQSTWAEWSEVCDHLAELTAASDATDPAAQFRLIQLRLREAQLAKASSEALERYEAAYDELRATPATWQQVTLLWPKDSPVPTIGGKWHRLASGKIQATYTREELALSLGMMREAQEATQQQLV